MRFGKLGLVVCTLALGIASAASTYKMNLSKPAWVGGKELQPGSYKIEIDGNQAVIKGDNKETVQVGIKTETANQKYSDTVVRLGDVNGQKQLQEVRIGGTKTSILFESGSAGASPAN